MIEKLKELRAELAYSGKKPVDKAAFRKKLESLELASGKGSDAEREAKGFVTAALGAWKRSLLYTGEYELSYQGEAVIFIDAAIRFLSKH